MRFQSIFPIIFLLILCTSTLAQDNFPVIDSQQIFTSDVDNVKQLPILQIDDDRRILHYFNPDIKMWTEHEYPTGLNEIQDVSGHIRQQSDGTYLINTRGFYGFSQQLADAAWIFDPKSEMVFRPEPVCNGWIRSQDDEWIIIETAEGYRLCNIFTDERSAVIPAKNEGYCPDHWRKPLILSPSKTYILFFCGGYEFELFSYNISQQTFLSLGESPNDLNENIEVIEWLSDIQIVIRGYPSWNPPANVYYVADIDKPDGLEFVTYGLYESPRYFENPSRIEWFPCEYSGCSPDSNSVLHSYNFENRQLTVYQKMSDVKGMSLTIPDGSNDRLYRSLVDMDLATMTAESANLLRFNYVTEQSEVIYSGEIEWIESISPNGEYAVLQMGSDEEIASSLVLAHNQVRYLPSGKSLIHVIDLVTGKKLFDATGLEFDRDFYVTYNPVSFDWINDDTFLISGVEEYNYGNLLVTLDPQPTIIEQFSGIARLSLSRDYILLDSGSVIEVYEIETHNRTRITQDKIAHTIFAGWSRDDSIVVRIMQDGKTIAHWLVSEW